MAQKPLTIRLEQDTAALLRRGAYLRNCDQKDILEAAVAAFVKQRSDLLSLSPRPVPPKGSRDALIFAKRRRIKRKFYKNLPTKFTTTISEETHALIRSLTSEFTKSDLIDRSVRYFLWMENRQDFGEFLCPRILDEEGEHCLNYIPPSGSMIHDLQRIRTDSILVDSSLILAVVYTASTTNPITEECSEFLLYCAKMGILIQVTPETCLLLWKSVFSTNAKQAERPQSPIIDPLFRSAKRVNAFLKGPVDILCLTPDIMSQSIDLWLEKRGHPGIEACVAMSALRATRPSPYFIATANDHYDSFEAHDVVVMKPFALNTPSSSKVRPNMG